MPRTKLDTGLLDLRMLVMQVGLLVEDSLAKTLKAVETGNHTSLPWIIETNDTVGTLCTAIERQSLRLLILQQPLGGEIQYILRQAIESFDQRNAVIAKSVMSEQDLVELRYAPLCKEIMEMQAQHTSLSAQQRDATFVQRMTYLLWIAHKLAEMATYVSDICQRVIFIVEGQLNIQSGS